MKKILSLVLSAVMLISAIPALAANKLNQTEFYYYTDSPYLDFDNGASSLTGYNATPTTYLTVNRVGTLRPLLMQGGKYRVSFYNITWSNNAREVEVIVYAADGTELKSVVIPHNSSFGGKDGFVEIGDFDFASGESTYITVGYPREGENANDINYLRYNCIKLEQLEAYDDYYSFDFSDEDTSRTLTERRLNSKEGVYIPEVNENARKIYVKAGSNGDGSESNPFGTIEAARNKAREIIANGYPEDGVAVLIHGGDYKIQQTLTFDESDSGTEAVPVIYKAYGDGEVNITMADILDVNAVTKVTDEAVLSRIPQNARDNIYSVDLGAEGVSVSTPVFQKNSWNAITMPDKLIIDDEKYEISHYPNIGEMKLSSLMDSKTRATHEQIRTKGSSYSFENDPRMLMWSQEDMLNAKGKFDAPYTAESTFVTDINEKLMIASFLAAGGTVNQSNPDTVFYNLLCEIDTAGEFYIDRTAQKLYFYPKGEITPNSKISLLTTEKTGIQFKEGAKNMALLDINVKMVGNCGMDIADNTENIMIAGAEVAYTRDVGINIRGKRHTVRDCDLYAIGTYGIQCTAGKQATAEKGECLIENNAITDTANAGTTAGAAIRLGYDCGNTVRYNHLYDLPYQGILWGGFMTTIENNLIEKYCQATSDAGAIYCCSATCYGSVIRNNIIRDALSDGAHLARGVYFDDGTFAGTRVENNIFKNVGGITQTGRDMYFYNNVLIWDEDQSAVSGQMGMKITSTGGKTAPDGYWMDYDFDAIRATGLVPDFIKLIDNEWDNIVTRNRHWNNNVFYNYSEANKAALDEWAITYKQYGAQAEGNVFIAEKPDKADFSDIDWEAISAQNPDIQRIDIADIGTYTGGLRTNTTDMYSENLPAEFEMVYPEDGARDVETELTFKWTNLYKKAYNKPEFYIAENEDFSKKLNNLSVPQTGDFTVELEPDTTYYYKIGAEALGGYGKRYSETRSFRTISYEDILKKKIIEANMLLKDTTEGTAQLQYDFGAKKALKKTIAEVEASEATAQEKCEVLDEAMKTYRKSQSVLSELETYLYEDMEGDIAGDRCLSFFTRNSLKDTKTKVEWEDDTQTNKAIRMTSDLRTQNVPTYAMNCFPVQDKYVEVYTSVKVENEGVAGSVLIQKSDWSEYDQFKVVEKYTPIAIIFGADGKIYSSYDKEKPSMPYTVGEWYDVVVKADISARTYDVYVNKELLASTLPFSINDEDLTIGKVMFSETEGTFNSRYQKKGSVLYDNYIVRGPKASGKNCYLTNIKINGEDISGFDISKSTYYVDMTEEELKAADISFVKNDDAAASVYDYEGGKYIAVIADNKSDVMVYNIIPTK